MKQQPCSHDYRDVRFKDQLVFNWPIAPYMSTREDGQPDKCMQYGQTYECSKCHEQITLRHSEPLSE